jgi:hypothetical protein
MGRRVLSWQMGITISSDVGISVWRDHHHRAASVHRNPTAPIPHREQDQQYGCLRVETHAVSGIRRNRQPEQAVRCGGEFRGPLEDQASSTLLPLHSCSGCRYPCDDPDELDLDWLDKPNNIKELTIEMNWVNDDDLSRIDVITEVIHQVSAKRSQGSNVPEIINIMCLEFPVIPLDEELMIGAEAMAAGVNVSFRAEEFDPSALPL